MSQINESDITKIASLTKEQLKGWTRGALKYGYFAPVEFSAKDTSTALIFCEIWDQMDVPSSPLRPDERIGFQNRIKELVYELCREWTPPSDPAEYMCEILYVIGYLVFQNCFELLLDLAFEESLKGISSKTLDTQHNFDLHREILKVLFGMKTHKDPHIKKIKRIITRDIDDPRYSTLCFRRAWELDPVQSIHYIRKVVKCALRDARVDLSRTLIRYHLTTGFHFFRTHFLEIRNNLLQRGAYVQQKDSLILYLYYLHAISTLCMIQAKRPLVDKIGEPYASIITGTTPLSECDSYIGKSKFVVVWHPVYQEELTVGESLQTEDIFEEEEDLLQETGKIFELVRKEQITVRAAIERLRPNVKDMLPKIPVMNR